MKILLDTNFLIDMVRFKTGLSDIESLIGLTKLATLSSVKKELSRISKRSSKAGLYAKVALNLLEEYKVEIIKSEKRPDDAVVELVGSQTIIATNDTDLRKRVKRKGGKTIYLKSKKHLAIG